MLVAVLGVLIAVVGVGLSTLLALLMDDLPTQIRGFGLFSSMIAIPAAVSMLLLSTVLTSVHYARMWILAVALMFTIAGGVLMMAAMTVDNTLGYGFVAGVLFYGMPVALIAMALVYNAAIGIPAARTFDYNARVQALADLIADKGTVPFAGARSAVNDEDVVGLAAEVRRRGLCQLEIDLHRERLWGLEWADQQCNALRQALRDEGRVVLGDFATARDVPAGMVQEWVYTLVYRREITAYVSWKDGVLYSADAAALKGSSRCPSCAGQLELVARGVIQCQHCDAQTLLGAGIATS